MEVVTIESKVDWNTVKAEYVAGGISQRAIAEKYGISWSTLQKRAQKEKWAKVRQAASDKIVEKTVQKAAKMNADNATLAADIKRKGLVILNNLFDDFAKVKATEHRDYKGRNLVARVMGDYDVKADHANEHFVGEITYPEKWNIDVIVGGSGTGKTSIIKELFPDYIGGSYEWTHKSVIDDMPKAASVDEIEKMFYAVGFGSVPSWLKPYNVLSNGEKMRVELARAMLESDFIVFDEFTSVVDRQVAQTASMAINKAVHRMNKQFIAVTCHYDVLEWLQPDWVFDTNEMRCFFTISRDRRSNTKSGVASAANGRSLGVITI